MRTFGGMFCALSVMAGLAQAEFTDVTRSAGVHYLQWNANSQSEVQRMTGGAAAGDVDGDGFPDLFVTRFDGPDILFKNDGQGGFTDVSRTAGFRMTLPSNGVAMGDIDNDGDRDIYLTSVGDYQHYLFINDGTGKFREQGRDRGAAIRTSDLHRGMSAAWGDYDRDGYLDLHVTEWGNTKYLPPTLWSHSRLLRNQGAENPGHFEDQTVAADVVLDNYVGFTVKDAIEGLWTFTSTFADFDRDGHADLAVVGDFETSRLYWNNGDGTFLLAPNQYSDAPSGIGTDENGMGSAIGDFNNDGWLDWFVTSIYDADNPCVSQRCNWKASGNRLYLNNGDRTFTDVTDLAGVRDGGWGWGTTFFDYDNDGDQDLVMTNGMITPSVQSLEFTDDAMRLWRNEGNGSFTEVAALEGLTDTSSGKGLLTFDYDVDGDLDLFVVNNGGAPKLYRNDSDNGNAFLQLELVGTKSNRDGVGAFVTLMADADAMPQTRYLTGGGTNFLSQSDSLLHFGLGDRDQPVHQLIVDWPSGVQQVFDDVAINSRFRAIEPVPEPHAVTLLVVGGMTLIHTRKQRATSLRGNSC